MYNITKYNSLFITSRCQRSTCKSIVDREKLNYLMVTVL